MLALQGAFVKASEVLILFPFHHAIHKSQTNCKVPLKTVDMYKGVHFQLIQAPINRFVDIYLYESFGSSMQSSFLSSAFKVTTYPLHTAEVYYQLKNKLPPTLSHYYKGFAPYSIVNMTAYYVWFNSMQWYSNNLPKLENKHLHNGIVGFSSGLTVDLLMHPFKTIKTNLQNDSFRMKDMNPKYLFRGMNTKVLLSACQTAYFNILCNVI